ncbi:MULTISPECIES: replication-relaxation family protein [Bacillota]|uniref:replication-relaxation family protein n=1 Tax=Bacillota TaxID=1239 RepID=UPI0039EFA32D
MTLKHQVKTSKKNAVWFSEQDLELLQLIWDFKYLSLYQIKYYCERLHGLKPGSLEMKLRRWRDAEVLVAKRYTKPPAAKVFYRVGPEGVVVLKKAGLISPSSKVLLEDISGRRNYDHFFAIRDAVLLTLIELKKKNREVTSFSPSEMPYYESGFEGSKPSVVPDWVLVNSCGFLNIELDTGTEKFLKINEKVIKYVNYAQQRPNEIHHVLLVVLDENDPALLYDNEYSKDRSGRVANLKELIIQANAHVHSNLNFYVVTISRVGNIAYKIMTGELPLLERQRSNSIIAATKLLELNDTFNYMIEPMDASEFYLAEVKESLYADGHFRFVGKDKCETVLIKTMEEGDVKCLDQIQYLNLLSSENRFKIKVDKILAIYQSNEELHSDVLGKLLPNVHFTSKEQLSIDLETHPLFFKTVNTSKKEGVLLYGR